MTTALDPTLDLTVTRVIRASRSTVWRAWTDPALFAQWWIPAPPSAGWWTWTCNPVVPSAPR